MLYIFIFLEPTRLYSALHRYKKEETITDKNLHLARFFQINENLYSEDK